MLKTYRVAAAVMMMVVLVGCADRGLKEFAAYRDYPLRPPVDDQQAGALMVTARGLPITSTPCVIPAKGQPIQKSRVADVTSLRTINLSGDVSLTAKEIVTAKISPAVARQSDARYAGVIQELIPSPQFNIEDERCGAMVARALEERRDHLYYYHGLLQAEEVALTLSSEKRIALGLDAQKPLVEALVPITAGLTLEAKDNDTVSIKGTGLYFAYAPRRVMLSNTPVALAPLKRNELTPVPGDDWLSLRLVSVEPVTKRVMIEAHIRGVLPGMDMVKPYTNLSQHSYFWVGRNEVYYRFDVNQVSDGASPEIQLSGAATRVRIELE